MSSVMDQLEQRLSSLRDEVAEIETAIRVLKRLNAGTTAIVKEAPAMFTVKRTLPAGRPAGRDFHAMTERAQAVGRQILELLEREGKPMTSGEIIDLVGARHGKENQDRVYNQLATLERNSQLVVERGEDGRRMWSAKKPPEERPQAAEPASGEKGGPSGQTERAA